MILKGSLNLWANHPTCLYEQNLVIKHSIPGKNMITTISINEFSTFFLRAHFSFHKWTNKFNETPAITINTRTGKWKKIFTIHVHPLSHFQHLNENHTYKRDSNYLTNLHSCTLEIFKLILSHKTRNSRDTCQSNGEIFS